MSPRQEILRHAPHLRERLGRDFPDQSVDVLIEIPPSSRSRITVYLITESAGARTFTFSRQETPRQLLRALLNKLYDQSLALWRASQEVA